MAGSRLVPTPLGDARVVANLADDPVAILVLGHGAGGGIEARDLEALAAGLPDRRVSVLRVEQPWRVRGGRVAPAPPRLDIAWLAARTGLTDLEPSWVGPPLVVGGRSAGARVACRTAVALGAVGAVALAFPLHPPGRPDKTRVEELTSAGVPVLVVQGERDAFGTPGEFPVGTDVQVIPAADHSFAVPRRAAVTQPAALELLVLSVSRWLLDLVGG